ncbi:hypothetical protein [Selenomonas montiformis]|nr:hypothetical protein [Selenomonas montiformis]
MQQKRPPMSGQPLLESPAARCALHGALDGVQAFSAPSHRRDYGQGIRIA